MQENFELDKIVLAAALAFFLLILSDHLSSLIYSPVYYVAKPGYKIDITDEQSSADVDSQSFNLEQEIDIKSIMLAADAKSGENIFKKCAICHTSDKNGVNKIGPNLWNIIGSVAANKKDFAYSAAMSKKHEQNFVWSYENLYRYLFAPKKFVEGTKMAFAGIKNDKDRANLIAYLRTFADTQATLP